VNNDSRQYLQRAVQTATPGQLVVMLYDGFQRFTSQARAAFEEGNVGEGGLKLSRAQAIVTELRCTLDMSREPISTNLASIYDWVSDELTASRMQRDLNRLARATQQMGELRGSWAQIAGTERPIVEISRPVVGVNLAG
jgi:flagellar secretion chaperone FliS